MKTIRELHNEAMDLVDEARPCGRRRKKTEEAQQLYGKAFELEMEALKQQDPASDKLGWSITGPRRRHPGVSERADADC